MKMWIDGNTSRRARADNDFEKDLFKLANNACFGKTMEGVRGRMDMRLVNASEDDNYDYKRIIAKPAYEACREIGSDQNGNHFYGIQLLQREVTLDKPIFAGMSILDFSKSHMYHYHYEVFTPMFGAENLRLGATDTDSFMYSITCDNIDEKIKEHKDHFDLSNYPKEHPLRCDDNKKVLGKFKNEMATDQRVNIITERVNLRSKLYGFKLHEEEKDTLRCKGVKKCVVKNTLKVDDYIKTLETQKSISCEQVQLRSYNHTVYTIKSLKVALSSYDDKRFILQDGKDTRAHGHWRNQYGNSNINTSTMALSRCE